mmetsp:Transcript_5132/g.14542  ORF Transcript_5132/g.14542 Transcript_5132/m.14542 type:complete len:225 (-) Transcript_5132:116-790(-)
MILLVHSECLPLLGRLQMDGKIGNSHNGPINLQQPLFDPTALGMPDHHTSRDAQIAIEPRMPQTTAVALHGELDGTAASMPLAAGLHLEVWRVRVSSNNFEAIAGLVLFSHRERHDGTPVLGKVVLATGHHPVGVRRCLVQFLESFPLQFSGGGGNDVIRIGTGVDVGAALLGQGQVVGDRREGGHGDARGVGGEGQRRGGDGDQQEADDGDDGGCGRGPPVRK